MDHSDIDHEKMTSAYLKVLGHGPKEEVLTEIVTPEGEQLDEARLVTKDGKFIVMTDNDTEAATFEDRESALEYIKNNKDKLMVRDHKTSTKEVPVEGKKAKKDYDGDGEIESPEAEYKGSKDRAIKKAMAKEAHDTDGTLICKDCGCELGSPEPKCECPHDAHDPSGSNWKAMSEAKDRGEFSGDISFMGHDKLKHHYKTGEKNKTFSKGQIKKEFERRRDAANRRKAIFGKDTTPSGKPGPNYESVKEANMSDLQYDADVHSHRSMTVKKKGNDIHLHGKWWHDEKDHADMAKIMGMKASGHTKTVGGGTRTTLTKPGPYEAHAKVDQFVGHKHAKRAGINVKTHGQSWGGRGDNVTLSHPDKKKLQRYVSNHLDGETQGIKVKESVGPFSEDHPQSKLTKTQRRALASLDKKKKKAISLPHSEFLTKEKEPKKVGRGSEVVKYEGYEADVSKFMNKHGIDHHWSGGKLHVDKKDHAHAEKKLTKKYGGYGPRGAKMMPQLHINKESTMVTRSNWLEKFYEKKSQIAEDYKQSPHHSDDATRDTWAKQLSTRKGEEAFVKMHEPHTPEYADGPAVNMKTFADMTKDVKAPTPRHNDHSIGDKAPVAPVDYGKAGRVGAKD